MRTPLFDKAFQELPSCVDADPGECESIADLLWYAQIQLDLIAEGQDGTEDDDPKAIRRWMKKWKAKSP